MKMNKSEFIRLAALSKYSTWCEAEDYVAENPKSFIQSTISLRYITIIRKNTVMDIIKAWLKPMVSTDEPQQCITA